MSRVKIAIAVAWIGLALPIAHAQQPNACGPLSIPNKYGPYDYRLAPTGQRELVEHAHFTTDVAELRKPMFQYFGPDLHYTLWAFPNHPRALLTLINLTVKDKTLQPTALPYTAECYFERALRFKSDDVLARMLYALFLKTYNRKEEALRQLDFVVETAGDSPMSYYNAGKLYFELGQLEKSQAAMRIAVDQGVPYVDLIDKLKQAGHWQDEKKEEKKEEQEEKKEEKK